jgi:Ca2+-binding RTX toxin-like protein
MRPRLASLAAAVALAPCLVPATSADAAATLCQGQEATIVDDDGGRVEGTVGDDVIVARGPAVEVRARAGDDTVCMEVGFVGAGRGDDSVQARGTDGDDLIRIRRAEDLDIALGGGFDSVALGHSHYGTGVVDAGTGYGLLLVSNRKLIDIDLEDGTMALDVRAPSYQVRGFQRVMATAYRVALTGDRQANVFEVVSTTCDSLVKGGRGDDRLLMRAAGVPPSIPCGRNDRTRFLGQRGDDRLQGSVLDDVLIGGPGRDVAKGWSGSDKCRAERTKSCER